MDKKSSEHIFSRQELIALASRFDVQTIVGTKIERSEITAIKPQLGKIEKQLINRGYIDGNAIPEKYKSLFQILFTPERAFMVIRERPDVGKQVLIFLTRAGRFLLHSFPKKGQHRIIELSLADIERILFEWFPSVAGAAKYGISMQESQLTDIIQKVEQGSLTNASSLLANVDSPIKENLIKSLKSRQWSGSFALLVLENDQAVDADSFTAWSGKSSTWSAGRDISPGALTLIKGGDAFIGQLRQLIRKLAQFDKIVRAYRLSANELAFALSVVNQQSLANQLLKLTDEQLTDENWQTTRDNLQKRGLIRISSQGSPLLTDDLEDGLTPLILHSRIDVVRTISQKGTSQGTLYVLKNKSFCTHFIRDNVHLLECGNIALLPNYLLGLFHGFGNRKALKRKSASIRLDTLTRLLTMGSDKEAIEKELIKSSIQKDVASDLAIDLADHAYRASITGVKKLRENNKHDDIGTRSSLLLLKGRQQDWVVAFPSGDAKTIGKMIPADREVLLKQFSQITG